MMRGTASLFGASPLLEVRRPLSEVLFILSQTESLFDADYAGPLLNIPQRPLFSSLRAALTHYRFKENNAW